MRVHVLQHVPFEGPGHIATWATARGHGLTHSLLYAGAPLPDPTAYDLLVSMGGPMGVGDTAAHPWLAPELEHIRAAIAAGRAVLGVCLGAQLIAAALGAAVYPNPVREIGWFPLHPTAAGRAHPLGAALGEAGTVLHWHGETFDLPAGALHLASSSACPHQAFLYGDRVLALQCHLEVTPAAVAALCTHASADLVPGPWVQDAASIQAAATTRCAPLHALLEGLLDRLTGAVG